MGDQGKLQLENGVQGYVRQRPGRDALEAVIEVPGRGTVRRATGYKTGQEAEARRFLQDVLRELEAVAPAAAAVPDELTFQQWAEQWVAERKKRGIVAAFDEESHLRYHAYPQLGAYPLRSLTKTVMLQWVRDLPQRTSERTGRALAPRYVHHIAATVRHLLREASLKRDLIPVSPCVWDDSDLPAKVDRDPSKRRSGGFQPAEVVSLLFDVRIPEDRRALYALEFLTGMRTGEAAARRWRDFDDQAQPLGRLEVRTAWNTRIRKEGATKTLIEKVAPVHPLLARVLRDWKERGWAEYVGRSPTDEDLIVPSERGRVRNASYSNELFQQDLRTLELRPAAQERRTHYETRSTFRSLALAGGAVRSDLDLSTHPSPKQASDLYTRLDVIWPALCRAVESIVLPVSPTNGECTTRCTNEGAEQKKAPAHGRLSGGEVVTRTGLEPMFSA